jgi:hypothetical protein
LAQLRDGYIERDTTPFPRSIALIGMRNIRDYKADVRPDSETLGSGSPFNIAEALTLANFTQEEINALYGQHTKATGQVFSDEAVQKAWYWSEGQPWLVNALAREAVGKILGKNYGPAITEGLIDQAADNLMKRRDTHIDSLLARLSEPQVKRFIEPMLAGSENSASMGKNSNESQEAFNNDLQYCVDLGLVKRDNRLRPANPIYASVMVRHFNENVQYELSEEFIGKWMDAQSIDITGLLKEFQKFWVLNSEKYLRGFSYTEAGPHLLFSAFLQRAVNGGATVIHEFADGLGYVDVLVQYAGKNYVLELKIKENQRSLAKSQEQLLGYMDQLLTKEGWLLIFDRQSPKSRKDKITWKTVTKPSGRKIHVLGL